MESEEAEKERLKIFDATTQKIRECFPTIPAEEKEIINLILIAIAEMIQGNLANANAISSMALILMSSLQEDEK